MKVHAVGRGMLTPLGANTQSSFLAFKAGINRYQSTPIMDKYREPMTCSFVPMPALPELRLPVSMFNALTATERQIVRLCHYPIGECLGAFSRQRPIPLFLSVSEPLPQTEIAISGLVIEAISKQVSMTIDFSVSKILATGRAGGLHAIKAAFDYMAQTENDFALVGGVETYCGSHERLNQLDWEGRLHSQHSMDGFVPGEATGFLLLASEKAVNAFRPKCYLTLSEPGESEESGHLYSSDVYIGEALANAVADAFSMLGQNTIDTIYSTMNGESYWAKEFGVASARQNAKLSEGVKHQHPADCYGDIGAASASVLLGFVCEDTSTVNATVWCSSDMTHRAAIYVEK